MNGDHGLTKKADFYDAAVRVPLIIRSPEQSADGVCDHLVELFDLSATMVEWAQAEVPQDWQARSVLPSTGRDAHREIICSELKGEVMVFDGRYKLILDPQGQPAQCYDCEQDNDEMNDLLDGDFIVPDALLTQAQAYWRDVQQGLN